MRAPAALLALSGACLLLVRDLMHDNLSSSEENFMSVC